MRHPRSRGVKESRNLGENITKFLHLLGNACFKKKKEGSKDKDDASHAGTCCTIDRGELLVKPAETVGHDNGGADGENDNVGEFQVLHGSNSMI